MGEYIYIVDTMLDDAMAYLGAYSTKEKAMEAVEASIQTHINDGWRLKTDDKTGQYFLERYTEMVRRGRTGNYYRIRVTKMAIR